MKSSVTLSALLMSVALAGSSIIIASDAQARGGYGKGSSCRSDSSSSVGGGMRGPGVGGGGRSAGGADANFNGGTNAMAPNRSGNGKDR